MPYCDITKGQTTELNVAKKNFKRGFFFSPWSLLPGQRRHCNNTMSKGNPENVRKHVLLFEEKKRQKKCHYSIGLTVNTDIQARLGRTDCSASKGRLVSSLGPGCNLVARRGPAPIGLCPPCAPVMTPSLWGAFDLGCVCASAGPISGVQRGGGVDKGSFQTWCQ